MKKILWTLILASNIGLATNYGLIVGISDYKNIGSLGGVDNDIQIYENILKKWEIHKLVTLNNQGATKVDILNNLNTIAKQIKKGDKFFMFFSGHGTNLNDIAYTDALQKAGLSESMKDSGAILPYDFNKNSIRDTIIIGKNLKKILKGIDDKISTGLIMFDACFSGNSIRDNKGKKINQTPYILTHSDGYPYKNIDYIASSVIESNPGKFSPILEKCLTTYQLNDIKNCINSENQAIAPMLPAIIAGKSH